MYCEQCTIFTPSALHAPRNRTTSTSTTVTSFKSKMNRGPLRWSCFFNSQRAPIESDQSDESLSFQLANPFQSSRSTRLSPLKKTRPADSFTAEPSNTLPGTWRSVALCTPALDEEKRTRYAISATASPVRVNLELVQSLGREGLGGSGPQRVLVVEVIMNRRCTFMIRIDLPASPAWGRHTDR
jgi:hypothetical protein